MFISKFYFPKPHLVSHTDTLTELSPGVDGYTDFILPS